MCTEASGTGQVMPYNKQQHYWWLVGPPLLLPLYFHYENLRYVLGTLPLPSRYVLGPFPATLLLPCPVHPRPPAMSQ
eukprot:1627831-Rhodomonas_salina.1